mmetsp:Transcript_21276/g.24186  ORF Transcript_21276/g.24186 Transcript_21276/m.24186 type:complete len:689 (+) Transcript_21276:162-2228(+)
MRRSSSNANGNDDHHHDDADAADDDDQIIITATSSTTTNDNSNSNDQEDANTNTNTLNTNTSHYNHSNSNSNNNSNSNSTITINPRARRILRTRRVITRARYNRINSGLAEEEEEYDQDDENDEQEATSSINNDNDNDIISMDDNLINQRNLTRRSLNEPLSSSFDDEITTTAAAGADSFDDHVRIHEHEHEHSQNQNQNQTSIGTGTGSTPTRATTRSTLFDRIASSLPNKKSKHNTLPSSSPTSNTDNTNNNNNNHNNTISITILDSAQKKFKMNVNLKWTTQEFKLHGQKIHSIQPQQQRLICMGKLLMEDKTLEEQSVTKNGMIIHLFPKPNVIITNNNNNNNNNNNTSTSTSNSTSTTAGGEHENNSESPRTGNGNNEEHETNNGNGGGGGAHVPQIILDRDEITRSSEILVLSSHEAYEAMHRVRLLSFLLLAYCVLQLLRDVTIFLAPTDAYGNHINGSGGSGSGSSGNDDYFIPPGDPTDTRNPNPYTGSGYGENGGGEDEDLPPWHNYDYIEICISSLGVYVALLGMKVTTEHVGSQARLFMVLLAILGISWTFFTYYLHVKELQDITAALNGGGGDESGGGSATTDGININIYRAAMIETTLPVFIWIMFFIRALQFYTLLREAEIEAGERARHLMPMLVSNDDNNNGGSASANANANASVDEQYDLELQAEEGRTIT